MRRWILNTIPPFAQLSFVHVARANADGADAAVTEDLYGLQMVFLSFQRTNLTSSARQLADFLLFAHGNRCVADGADINLTEDYPGAANALAAFQSTPFTS